MFLAEDRVRGKCDVNVIWTFVSHTVGTKRGALWVLHYVKAAYAVTDRPDQVRVKLSWSSLSI